MPVAYLLQDSEHSGVPYGNAVDVESLLDALTIAGSYKDIASAPDKLKLGIEEGGVSAAEAVLAGVYWMYRNVYWRHTNRAFSITIKTVVKRLLLEDKLDFATYWTRTREMCEWEALGYLHESFEKHKPQSHVNPLASLVHFHRVGYFRVLSIYRNDHATGHLHRLIQQKLHLTMDEDLAKIIGDYLTNLGVPVTQGQILVDIPVKHHLREKWDMPVVWREHISKAPRKDPESFLHYSRLATQLRRLELSGVRMRVFFSRELREEIKLRDLADTVQAKLSVMLQTELEKPAKPSSDLRRGLESSANGQAESTPGNGS